MTRDERTIDEAEAERRGYEAAKAQAVAWLRQRMRQWDEAAACSSPDARLYALARAAMLEISADAIARMQPEDRT